MVYRAIVQVRRQPVDSCSRCHVIYSMRAPFVHLRFSVLGYARFITPILKRYLRYGIVSPFPHRGHSMVTVRFEALPLKAGSGRKKMPQYLQRILLLVFSIVIPPRIY